jgi:hypothetical protein
MVATLASFSDIAPAATSFDEPDAGRPVVLCVPSHPMSMNALTIANGSMNKRMIALLVSET